MTDEGDLGAAKKDPIVHFGSIPGADGTAPESAEVTAEGSGHSTSAYERVRGLLAEAGPPVGAGGKFSEKMTEEMESFERRWSERPVPTLVSAGKKMTDHNGSTGLNRLLGLPVPATDAEADAGADETSVDAREPETDHDVDEHDIAERESVAPEDDAEDEIMPFGEDDSMPPGEPADGELWPQEPEPEPTEDRTMAATPTARMIAVQTAYSALNPLEAEIFRSQMGLMDATQFRAASARSQELALATIHRYEQEAVDLRQQLETARGEAEAAEQEAASRAEALTAQVLALESRLELLSAELVAARREAADGDDSEGGAGRQLVKGHDDLRTDDDASPTEADDRSDEDAPDDAPEDDPADPEEADGSDLLGDEGDGGMAQMLQLLVQGEDAPVLGQDFGE